MKKIIKFLTIVISLIMLIGLSTGCINIKQDNLQKYKAKTWVPFHKGVYKSYSPEENAATFYFYVFYDENSGHTEDSEKGIGLPFSCVQTADNVKFKFGSSEEPEDIFYIKSVKKDLITGSFKNGKLLIFVPLSDAKSDNFDAVEYMKNSNIK